MKKRAIWITIALLLVAYWTWLIWPPVYDLPRLAVPSPNAYNYDVAAAQSFANCDAPAVIVDQNTPSTLEKWQEYVEHVYWPDTSVVADAQFRKELLKRNTKTLAIARQGLRYGYVEPSPDCGAIDSDREKIKSISMLLLMDADERTSMGDAAAGARSYLDALAFVAGMPFGAREPIRRYAVCALSRLCGKLDAADLRDDDARLAAIQLRTKSITVDMQASMVEFELDDKHAGWPFAYPATAINGFYNAMRKTGVKSFSAVLPVYLSFKYLTMSHTEIISGSNRYYRKWMRRASQPYAKALQEPFPKTADDPITRFTLHPEYQCLGPEPPPYPADMVRADFEQRAIDNLLAACFALRRYRLDNGHYPETLLQLAPKYLTEAPLDPYTCRRHLKYAPQGKDFTVYSVGPDEADDGGAPLNLARSCCSEQKYAMRNKGDIVAHASGIVASLGSG